ncbi:hypothetical protein DFR30_2281 [Thiogranum longum]|uniref:Uncharacterized protein n=1 Tax=Thiogranum longum TaxID=1537524 RepID=A0A4R1HE40_9GAMM|nr:hypothetical protein [Thiogranum longum]TCK18991.1 hypothetical protein DFR30_2281 [Thiogranum longum]
MLACYPLAATQENWLHETLVALIQLVHQKLDASQAIPETQQRWRALLDVVINNPHKRLLIPLRGVRDRLFAYKREVANLSNGERAQIFGVLESQNQIVNLLADAEPISSIEQDFPLVNTRARELFEFCYGKLTDLEVRERQYAIVFNAIPDKICPFCGIERLMNPEETAQDQDHYLAKSIYPFAAANMRNLVPMCRVCNRDYKKDIDVIRDDQGNRRTAFDPYNCQPVTVELNNSAMDSGSGRPIPSWQIEFQPSSNEAETWDNVFSIRKRYKRDVLDNSFDRWMRGFAKKCERDRVRGLIQQEFNDAEVRVVLANYQQDKEDSPAIGGDFLEPKAFKFLLSEFDEGNERIIRMIRDAVVGIDLGEVA